jgi:hypothetical protein
MKRISLAVMIAALGATGICRADTLKATLFEPTGQLVGFAVWNTDNAEPAADINIPDLGMTLNLHLRHNAIELAFKLSGAFPHGGIASVPGMLTKNSETDHGFRSPPCPGRSVTICLRSSRQMPTQKDNAISNS